MSIISSKHRLVKVSYDGDQYSAGPGIVIEDSTISVDPTLSGVIDDKLNTSDFETYSAGVDSDIQYVSANAGKTYSAGENIGISEDYVISSKDWTTDIANASSNAYEQATALIPPEFDPTYMSGAIEQNAGDIQYISGVAITAHQDLSYISGAVDNKLDATAFNLPNSAKWNESTNVVETNSADWGTITAFSSTSSVLNNQVTALRHDLITVITNTGYLYNDLKTTSGILSAAIDYVSANAGDEFPVSADEAIQYVQGNSATINDVNSFVNSRSGIWNWAAEGVETITWNSAGWDSSYFTVFNNSAQWGGGGGSIDTIPVVAISPLVTGFSGESAYLGIESTALNLSSYVPVSAIGVDSDDYVNIISGKYINAVVAGQADYAYRATYDDNNNEITSYYQPALTIAGDAGTITAINGSAVGASIPEGWELVGSAGISILDDSANNQTIISVTGGGAATLPITGSSNNTTATYDSNSAMFDYNETEGEPTHYKISINPDPSEGFITIYNSSDEDETNTTLTISDSNIQFKDAEDNYKEVNGGSIDSWNDATTAYQTNSGNYLTAHQPISANEWNSNYDTVTTNSGAWGGQSLSISAGAGIGLSMVDGVLVISVTGGN